MIAATHYTSEEGGAWSRWDNGPIAYTVLEGVPYQRDPRINGVTVHALAFGYSRWDSANGFTPEFVVKEVDGVVCTTWPNEA